MFMPLNHGEIVPVTAPYAATSGGGMLVGAFFGICPDTCNSGDTVQLQLIGTYTVPKDASVFALGDKVYWDNTAKLFTSTTASNTKVGIAFAPQLTGDATVIVRLVPNI